MDPTIGRAGPSRKPNRFVGSDFFASGKVRIAALQWLVYRRKLHKRPLYPVSNAQYAMRLLMVMGYKQCVSSRQHLKLAFDGPDNMAPLTRIAHRVIR